MTKTVRRIVSTSIIVVAIILLTIFMVIRTSNKTRDNAISQMKSIAQEQAVMVRNYVENAEQMLNAFSTADEVKNLLLDVKENNSFDPNQNYTDTQIKAVLNSLGESAESAQGFTSRFSETIDDPEGIWIGDWCTRCLTHTSLGIVGMTTRNPNDPKLDEAGREEKQKSLDALRDSMMSNKAGGYFYNQGIMVSPGKANEPIPHYEKLIVSMYKAVMDGDEPIGFVGFGVYTKNLAHALNKLDFNTEHTTYSIVNVADRSYIFSDDLDMVGKEVTDENIIDVCEKYAGSKDNVAGNYENKKNITFYSYMGDMGWVLFVNTPSSEVFEFSRSININMIVFCCICIILIVIFNIISFKQDETVMRLEQSKKRQAAITQNLHTAALKDILTDVNNRIKFIDDFSTDENGNYKVADCPNNPYCFALFNIAGFSRINIMHGHDVGDMVLTTTADILKEHFGEKNIYRVGSDEFVVAVQSPTSTANSIIMEINSALVDLRRPRKIGSLTLNVAYASSAVKKGTDISPIVLITLKDLININGIPRDGNVVFVDMDTMQ